MNKNDIKNEPEVRHLKIEDLKYDGLETIFEDRTEKDSCKKRKRFQKLLLINEEISENSERDGLMDGEINHSKTHVKNEGHNMKTKPEMDLSNLNGENEMSKEYENENKSMTKSSQVESENTRINNNIKNHINNNNYDNNNNNNRDVLNSDKDAPKERVEWWLARQMMKDR